jgi:pyruvate dehydrogenase E1 component alpha subunit
MYGTHRSHGHYLAKGGDPGGMVAEMLGKSTGCCNGAGGSMHMIDTSVGFMGSSPILGSAIPIGAGSALAQKMKGNKNITVAFMGDGASEEGIVYETINFAALHRLPYMMILEDNLYSVLSPKRDRKSDGYDHARVVEGLGADYYRADGNDFWSVYVTVRKAKEAMLATGKPAVVHCVAFRHMAHSTPLKDDNKGHRTIDNEENRIREDSVSKMRTWWLEHMHDALGKLNEMDALVDASVKNAMKFALESPPPKPNDLHKGVYFV